MRLVERNEDDDAGWIHALAWLTSVLSETVLAALGTYNERDEACTHHVVEAEYSLHLEIGWRGGQGRKRQN